MGKPIAALDWPHLPLWLALHLGVLRLVERPNWFAAADRLHELSLYFFLAVKGYLDLALQGAFGLALDSVNAYSKRRDVQGSRYLEVVERFTTGYDVARLRVYRILHWALVVALLFPLLWVRALNNDVRQPFLGWLVIWTTDILLPPVCDQERIRIRLVLCGETWVALRVHQIN